MCIRDRVDIVVTMGCNVQYPTLPCSHREDWGFDDPSERGDQAFLTVMARIKKKILDLKRRIRRTAWDKSWKQNIPELLSERSSGMFWSFCHLIQFSLDERKGDGKGLNPAPGQGDL